jgi:SHS family lactate transporter-like MFS transporter
MAMSSPDGRGHRAALVAGFLGWTLDAFDFFLVVLCATAIASDLGRTTKEIALSITVSLAFRPVGALLFGLLADRYGRRLPLMIDLVFYSLCEVATGFVRDYKTFLVLRALFGIGMGGEWGVGASLAMEKAPSAKRGLLSGLLQEGYAVGYLLAALAYFVVFPRWGWRPLFFIGGLPALLAIYVRLGVEESEVWRATKHESWSQLGKGIVTHWKTFLYIAILMMAMNLASHGTQDMFPTLLEKQWKMGPEMRSGVTAISMAGAVAGGLLFGHLSDRIGRRRAMVIAYIGGLLMIPLWAFAPSIVLLVVGAFFMQLMVQGAWGVVPAHINELSPDSVRGFLPGFGYQCGVLLASSIVYLEALFAERVSYSRAMASVAGIVFALAIVIAILGRERRGVVFGEGKKTGAVGSTAGVRE